MSPLTSERLFAPSGFARADADVEGQQRQQIDVRFDAGARLVVSLTGADGQPVVGQDICVGWWPEREVSVHLSAMARSRTDARGGCSFDGVMPATYNVLGRGRNRWVGFDDS